jgi:C4-dicarboxylate transporter DctQ subunit
MVINLAVAVVIVFLQVILRYIFGKALPWIEELARYLFIYATWLGTSAAISSKRHIRSGVLLNKFPQKAKVWVELFGSLVCLAMSLFMFIYGIYMIRVMSRFSATSAALYLPMYVFYIPIPLSGLLMIVKYGYVIVFEQLKPIIQKEAA